MAEKPSYEELERQIQQLQKAECYFSAQRDRAEHLRNILLAIRNVNQLIVRETDPKALIKKVCSELTNTRGYFNAWIALMDEAETCASIIASSGFNRGFDTMKFNLQRGMLPSCMQQTLGGEKLSVIKNPQADCPDCPLSSEYAGRSGMSSRLSYGGKAYGILSVSVPAAYAYDKEEHDLFTELAVDLAFALNKIETDKKIHRLNRIVTSIPQPISFVSQDYRYLAVNDVYAELFKIDAQKIIGQTPAEFFGEQVFETEIRPRLDHVLKGNVLHYEIQADFPGRGKRWMSMSYYPYRNKNGDITGVISHGHDITERKQAEEALHKSEERFSLAMKASKDGIWDWDLTTGYIYCSPALTSMLGYDSIDVIEHADQWQELIYPEDRQKAYQANLDCVNNLTDSFEIEYRMKTKDGGWKWILGRGEAVYRDASGRAVRMIGTHQDITERKQAEDAFKLSEAWLGETMRIARVGGWKIDLLGNTLEWTDETFRIHELPIGDPPNVDEAILFYHAEDRPWVSTAVQHAVANGEGFDFEARIITAKQNLIWVRSIGHTSFHEGRMVLVWGMIQDITERKLAEEALRESELRFRSYIEHAPLGIFVADGQGRYIEVNPSAERITGYAVEQLTSMSIPDLLVPESRENGLKHFQALINTGQSYGETAFRRADGSIGYWNVSATRLGPDRYLGFVEDITERKEREDRIALLGHMLDHAPAGVTIHNTEGHFLFSNRQNMLMHGYEREEEFLALNLHQIDLPESEAMLAERFRKIYEEGEARFEVAHFRKDGSIIELEVTAKTIDWYGQIAILSIAIDISERKRAEKELKAERDQIFSLFNSIDEIIYIADPQTHELLYINRHLEALLPENGIGKKCYKVLQNLDSPCSFCTNDIIFGNMSEPHRWEYYNPFLDQHYAIIDRVIHWSDGRDVRFEMAVDISGIKEAEAEKEKLQGHLLQAQKMESVGRLAGGVAHDFNNMLGVILGHAEFALEKAAENHDLYTDLKEIQTAAQRSADLTRQLLTFARKQIIDPRKLDLNHTVENMLSMLRRLIGEDIDLSWEPARQLWPVKMDSSQVDQILANLCVNARDAIAGVGKLTIETGMVSFDEAYCKDHAGFIPGDFVMIAVSDDGCGMDKETLNNLFEPFFTTKEVGKGTGLGLATIYGIVKQNNGFINVYSEPGQGTTFRIYLPRYSAANETHEVIQPEKPAPTGNETILLVEDEPAILNMTRMMLERKGYSVLPAATPAKAIALSKTHADKIHLLMTDVVMPEMNGRDLAGHVTELYPDIRLLFMSGYTANIIAHQGVLDEGVAFIQKPFSMADLAEKIREVLDMVSDKNQG